MRPFLKWAGGKYRLTNTINAHLPKAKTLIEPFVGAGSVFLNSEYEHYILADINPDLINLYKIIKDNPEQYIQDCERYFTPEYNDKEVYLRLRSEFNASTDKYKRSLLFLYMNRHGYNGLCRYNKKGIYNVPFGSYKKPYFPKKELFGFAQKAQFAEIYCEDFRKTFTRATTDAVIYCDPPYVPLSKTASFAAYASNGFGAEEQAELAQLAEATASKQGIPVLLSNHSTVLTKRLYHGAKIHEIEVSRMISRNGAKREKVKELLAKFIPQGK